jgi:hypothetical protein
MNAGRWTYVNRLQLHRVGAVSPSVVCNLLPTGPLMGWLWALPGKGWPLCFFYCRLHSSKERSSLQVACLQALHFHALFGLTFETLSTHKMSWFSSVPWVTQRPPHSELSYPSCWVWLHSWKASSNKPRIDFTISAAVLTVVHRWTHVHAWRLKIAQFLFLFATRCTFELKYVLSQSALQSAVIHWNSP